MWGDQSRPEVCRKFRPEHQICGDNAHQAYTNLIQLEQLSYLSQHFIFIAHVPCVQTRRVSAFNVSRRVIEEQRAAGWQLHFSTNLVKG